MPVGRTTTSSEIRAIVMVVIGLAIIVGGVAFFVNALASRGDVQVRLGDEVFDAGNAADIADEIADNGPILYRRRPAAAGTWCSTTSATIPSRAGWPSRPRRPGDDRDCSVVWNADAALFDYSCDSSLRFPPDGEGLAQFPATVTDGDIIIDINAAQRESTTTTASTSSVVISGS
ncbi:MAG: hypothetical protein R2749_11500 [Acidimicrobiales bacterium]